MKKLFVFLFALCLCCAHQKEFVPDTSECLIKGKELELGQTWNYITAKKWDAASFKNEMFNVSNIEIAFHLSIKGILFSFQYSLILNENYMSKTGEILYLIRVYDNYGNQLDVFLIAIIVDNMEILKNTLTTTIEKGYRVEDIGRIEVYQQPTKWLHRLKYYTKELEKLKNEL